MYNFDTYQGENILAIQNLIKSFLNNRLQGKLEKAKDEQAIDKLKQIFQTVAWLSDAARRVNQLQLVNYGVKFQNPNAKGTSIYLSVNQQNKPLNFVSTKTLHQKIDDVTGNAGALDVFKFLQLSHDSKTFLTRILENDLELRAALPGTEQQKTAWFDAFAAIMQAKTPPASHTLAKQLYFPIGNSKYHLLAPLFPTSLVQAVFEQTQTRFNESTKIARKARKDNQFCIEGYREYFNLAVQQIGGTKPQTVSQLNINRGGKCYLLPSLPPVWKSIEIKPPLEITSIFSIFRDKVKGKTKELRWFLGKVQHRNNNIDIRDTRAQLVANILDQLLFFASQIQSLPAGWSIEAHCKLDEAQMFWLDPGRAKLDSDWSKQRQLNDWQATISHQFALWLNGKLKTKNLNFGDEEYHEWNRLLEHEFALIKEVL